MGHKRQRRVWRRGEARVQLEPARWELRAVARGRGMARLPGRRPRYWHSRQRSVLAAAEGTSHPERGAAGGRRGGGGGRRGGGGGRRGGGGALVRARAGHRRGRGTGHGGGPARGERQGQAGG